MRTVILPKLGFAESWREQARDLLREGVPPDAVSFRTEGSEPDLLGALGSANRAVTPIEKPVVPASFIPLAQMALCHSSPDRFSLPYRVLWRLQQDRSLLDDRSDPDVAQLHALEKSVRRDAHKMKAFVRFRDCGEETDGRRRFIAWFEPDHFIVEATAPFFARRFADMDWAIVTPGVAALFEGGKLSFEPCDQRPDLPDDAADDLWRSYYASIFNPARLKVKAMKSEMPVKYWKNLPEARLIHDLIAGAEKSVQAMREAMPTLPSVRSEKVISRVPRYEPAPVDATLNSLDEARQAAATCTRCDLCRHATQTVFGEGPPDSAIMFVGEQPGDQEDLTGKPFTGPAGQLLNTLLEEAGIDRQGIYVTNAVKHFKFEPRGKRRIHMRPNADEIDRCRWWLDLERQFMQPKLIVALGATAALAVTGNGNEITRRRSTIETADDGTTPVFLTVHPSSVLRAGSPIEQAEAKSRLADDLRMLRRLMAEIVGMPDLVEAQSIKGG